MEDLNKDPGPVIHGCGSLLFIWTRFHPRPAAQSDCTREALKQAATTSVPSQRGVCCSILMTKTREGARSRYHTLICLKRASLTKQSAGVQRNPVKARLELGGGHVNNKREKQPSLFVYQNKGCPILECSRSSPKPRKPSRITMALLLHKAGSTAALHSHLSPVVKPFSAAQTIGRVPPLGDQIKHSFFVLQQGEKTCAQTAAQEILTTQVVRSAWL